MEKSEQLSPSESLEIISKMVSQARFNFSKNAFYFILWGVLLVSAAIFQFVGQELVPHPYFWAGWPTAGVLGGIVSSIKGRQISKQQDYETHIDKMYGLIWVFYFITLFVVLVALVLQHLEPGGYIMVLTGLPTILTGKLIKFNPLVSGGISFWIFGAIALFVLPGLTTQLFIISMITGYLIPGFMMLNVKDA